MSSTEDYFNAIMVYNTNHDNQIHKHVLSLERSCTNMIILIWSNCITFKQAITYILYKQQLTHLCHIGQYLHGRTLHSGHIYRSRGYQADTCVSPNNRWWYRQRTSGGVHTDRTVGSLTSSSTCIECSRTRNVCKSLMNINEQELLVLTVTCLINWVEEV